MRISDWSSDVCSSDLMEVRDHDELSEDELVNLLVFTFVGGYDTSKNVLTLMMYALLDKPEIYARCEQSFDYVRKVMHETLRFHNPGMNTRKVVNDFEFRGVRFPAGTIVLFPWSMSGRDETATSDPHTFNPDRPGLRQTHMAFGMGSHICICQFIGVAQIE